jgi:hypothetical protein
VKGKTHLISLSLSPAFSKHSQRDWNAGQNQDKDNNAGQNVREREGRGAREREEAL